MQYGCARIVKKLSDSENEIQRTKLRMKLSKTPSKMQIEEMANARKSAT